MEWGKKRILRELALLKVERLTEQKTVKIRKDGMKDLWVNQGIN